MSDVRWLAEHVEDGVLHGRVGRAGDELVAEWFGVARLYARRDGSGVRFVPEPDADPADVEKIRSGSARLLLRHLEGKVSLHGAAVAIGGRAIALVGSSGAGKSTLAAALCLRQGAQLLADDAIAIDRTSYGYDIVPLEVNHWLDEGARRALHVVAEEGAIKSPVHASSRGERSVPLVAIVALSFGGEAVDLAPLGGLASLECLLPQVVRFVVDEPEAQRAELDAVAHLVETVPVYRLERPCRFDLLDATVQALVDLSRR